MKALKNIVYNLKATADCQRAINRVKELESKLLSPWARFAIPFAFGGRGHFKKIEPRQNPYEIECLFKAVHQINPQRILEIGTARGGSLYLWTQAATDNATIVSLDLPGGDYGGAYLECRIPFYQSFAKPNQTLHLIRDDSHQPHSLDKVKDKFDQPLDFAFIDGDHTYEGVKQDFYMYGPLVRPGGLIAFHDIVHRKDDPTIQVDRFWNEIKDQYEVQEFIGPDGSGRKIGIGLLKVPDSGITQ